jgi:hypothetical protein
MIMGNVFAEQVSKGVDLPLAEVSEVIRALLSMYRSMDREGDPAEAFAEQVCEAAKSEGIAKPDTNLEPFRTWLSQLLLEDETLGATAKALEISWSYPNNYCRVRILTDFRPIFHHDPAKGPVTGLITHQIRMVYHPDESEEEKEFYVSADPDDLIQLRGMIDRAILKEASLKSSLERGGMKILES